MFDDRKLAAAAATYLVLQAGNWAVSLLLAGQIAHVVIAIENIYWTKRYVVYYIITEWCIPKKQIGPYH